MARGVGRIGVVSVSRLLAAVAAAVGAGPAGAVDFDWIGGSDGYFGDASQWSPGGGPPNSAADSATFNTASDIDVDFNQTGVTNEPTLWVNDMLTVERGDVTLDLVKFTSLGDPQGVTYRLEPSGGLGFAVRVGTVAGQTATLRVHGDDATDGTVEAIGFVQIGIVAGGTGRLYIGSEFDPQLRAFFQTTSLLQVGVAGAGEVVIADGVLSSVGGSLGGLTGASGEIELHESLSHTTAWSNVGDVTMGLQAGASGQVVLQDQTLWTNTGSVYLGGSTTTAGGTGLIRINTFADDALVDIGGDLVLYNGGDVELFGGTLTVGGQVTSSGAAVISLTNNAVLAVDAAQFQAQSALNWTGGTFRATNGMRVEAGGVFGSALLLSGPRTLDVLGLLRVGTQSAGTLTATASGTLTGTHAQVGDLGVGAGGGTLTIDGAGTTAVFSGALNVGGTGTANLMVSGGGSLTQADALLAPSAGTSAAATLTGAGSTWQGENFYLGGNATLTGGTGTLQVNSGAGVSGTGVFRVWDGYTVTVDGGSLALPAFDIRGLLLVQNGGAVQTQGASFDVVNGTALFFSGSTLNIEQSAATVTQGATLSADVLADAASTLTVQDANSVWATSQPVVLGGGGSGTNALGVLTVGTGGVVSADTLTLAGPGGLVLAGGTVMADTIHLGSNGLTGNGTLDGRVLSNGSITANGDLTLGDSADPLALQLNGPLNVGTHTVTLLRQGFFTAGSSVSIDGGTLAAPGGLALPTGSVTQGRGTLLGPAVVLPGATVSTAGPLDIGDNSAFNGFYGNGVFNVADTNTLTLLDANLAVLDAAALVDLQGNGSTLTADNGLVLHDGGSIVGRGTVNTPDDPFTPFINNGAVVGDSAANPITLTGYVKGVGTLDHVVITGTDAPGLSPATVYRGSVAYQGTLEIELAGTADGEFDRLIHQGQATLGGVLDLALLDSFAPTLGDTFRIIDAATTIGTFDSITGHVLGNGHTLALHYDATGAELVATLTGNYNADGYVGIEDLDILLANWGDTVTPGDLTHGDGSGDGQINTDDLTLVQAHWSNGTPPTNIPEPATASLLTLLTLPLTRRPRRHRR